MNIKPISAEEFGELAGTSFAKISPRKPHRYWTTFFRNLVPPQYFVLDSKRESAHLRWMLSKNRPDLRARQTTIAGGKIAVTIEYRSGSMYAAKRDPHQPAEQIEGLQPLTTLILP